MTRRLNIIHLTRINHREIFLMFLILPTELLRVRTS